MKIISLQVENIKKLVAIEIKPDGALVEITGKNGQGKTSVLDSIWWALTGTKHIQTTPIRKGQNTARIRLDLREIIVTRVFRKTKKGEDVTAITVENAQGAQFQSPQTILDALLGELSFDPLAFARMDARGQFDALRKFVPEVDFEAIDQLNKGDYDKRTDINRQADTARKAAMTIILPSDLPAKPINESGLVDKLAAAGKHNADIETRKANRIKFQADMDARRIARDKFEDDARRLRAEADELHKKYVEAEKELDAMAHKFRSAPPLPDPIDVSVICAQIEQARTINAQFGAKDRRDELIRSAETLEKESENLTHFMKIREEKKRDAIAAAKLPINGISFGDGTILINDVPFDQASDAEQLRVSIAIAMALNPKLRVIRVRDGSLLDEDSMKMVAKMAKDEDYQVWVETVSSDGRVGFTLEDGMLKAS